MSEWTSTTFGSLGELFDGPHATPTRRPHGPYFLNIASLKSGRLDLSESDHVSREDFKNWTRRVAPQAGDLLFSYETRLGEAALMPDGVEACLGRRMALLRPRRSVVDPRFLLYFYLSPSFQQTIARHTIHGATVPRIGLATMPRWPVALPSPNEQRAIAEVLGALDDKIAANDRAITTAAWLGRAMFAKAAVGGPRLRIANLASLVTRGVTPRYTDGQGLTVLNQKCVRDHHVDLHKARHMERTGARQNRLVRRDDVLVNSTGQGTLGRVARWTRDDVEATVDTHITLVRFDGSMVDRTCAGMAVLEVEKQVEALAEGSTGQTELRRDLLGAVELRLPPPRTQHDLGHRLRAFDDVTTALREESERLATARDELLPLLMSGKVRVRDAEKIAGEVT
jgi:type I restriction enzyme S subunit